MNKIMINCSIRTEIKPTQQEFGKISKGVKHEIEIDNVDQLEYILIDQKHPICPGIFKGNRENKNWISQNIILLDFDNNSDLNILLERCYRNNFKPNLVYATLSDTVEYRKFRFVFILDENIIDIKELKLIIKALLILFPEADKQCSDSTRIFLGGKETLYKNETLINKKFFIELLNLSLIANNDNNHKFNGVFKNIENHVKLNNCILDNNSIEFNIKTITNYNFIETAEKIKILNDFLNGKWLYYNELFGLATNLQYINGGLKLFEETMIKYNMLGITHYGINHFALINSVKKYNYLPMDLSKFSPYEEDKEYKNLLNVERWSIGKIENLNNNLNKITLMEAQEKFDLEFEDSFNSNNNNVYLFKLATGFGKTKKLESLKNVLIALPTHNLKDEVYERMTIDNVIKTPRIPEFKNKIINKTISDFYSLELCSEVNTLINKVSKRKQIYDNHNKQIEYELSDTILAKKYLNDLIECDKKTNTVLTTHARAMYGSEHSTIIFDEDPLQQILKIDFITVNDIYAFFNSEVDSEFKNIFTWIQSIILNSIEATKFFNHKQNKIISTALKLNKPKVLKFLNSKFVYIDKFSPEKIYFINRFDLPTDKKIIIMSATAPVALYKAIFKDRLKVIEIDNIEKVGEVIQYTKHSCSRQGLKRYGNNISKLVGKLPTITFREYKDIFENPVENMHFGNCSGYDELSGKDIAVVGTDHKPNLMYILIAFALSIELIPNDLLETAEYQLIEWNGFKFKFNTFQNKTLREIQLSLIESELIQAIGRNRQLRNECKTYLYSNLPLKQSDEFIY